MTLCAELRVEVKEPKQREVEVKCKEVRVEVKKFE